MLFSKPLMRLLEHDLNSYFNSPSYETDEAGNILLELDVPGFNKDNLNIEMSDGILTIQGETEKRTYYKQYSLGSIQDVNASIQDGILTLILVQEEKRVKKIKLDQPKKIENKKDNIIDAVS